MSSWLSELFGLFQDLIFPTECAYCRSDSVTQGPFCEPCCALIQPILSTSLVIAPGISVRVHAVSAYVEPIKTLILAKHRSDYRASRQLAALIWKYSVMKYVQADYLVPVPLHRRRQAIRGYNQTLVIAKELSFLSAIPVLDCVERIRNTKSQARCKRYERYDNVQGAFKMLQEEIDLEGKDIILVDDMMTSGATIAEVARLFVPYGVAKIRGIVGCGPVE